MSKMMKRVKEAKAKSKRSDQNLFNPRWCLNYLKIDVNYHDKNSDDKMILSYLSCGHNYHRIVKNIMIRILIKMFLTGGHARDAEELVLLCPIRNVQKVWHKSLK